MARKGGYNRRNYLLRVKAVNEVYLEHHSKGIPAERIFKDYIQKQFFIGRTRFFEYLTIPYKQELKKLDEVQQQQRTLFDVENLNTTPDE